MKIDLVAEEVAIDVASWSSSRKLPSLLKFSFTKIAKFSVDEGTFPYNKRVRVHLTVEDDSPQRTPTFEQRMLADEGRCMVCGQPVATFYKWRSESGFAGHRRCVESEGAING